MIVCALKCEGGSWFSIAFIIAKHHLLAILIIVALQNLHVHYVMIPSPADPHAPRVLHFSAFIYN